MKYAKELWLKAKWDLSEIKSGKLCYEVYPDLLSVFEPIKIAYDKYDKPNELVWDLDTLIRYTVLVYHRYSPFAVNEQNIVKRKIDVCEFIGQSPTKEYVSKVISNENKFANTTAIHFLKQENSIDWFELQQYLEAYYQIMQALTDDSGDNEKKTVQDIAKIKLGIVKEMKQIKQEIDILSTKIFNDDTNLLNYVERYQREEEANFVVLSPEDFVRSKRKVDE